MIQGKAAISIKPGIGVGDAMQYSSLPENYYRATGRKLIDVSRPWFFDHNPYVDRSRAAPPEITQELWNFSPTQYPWPRPRTGISVAGKPQVYLSNAEIWAALFGVPVVLNRPRLYRYEDVPYSARQMILLHAHGRSHGVMPDHVVKHIVAKYGPTKQLFQIGPDAAPTLYGLPRISTPTLWDLAKVISECRMFIGVDSGPAWIAACYPDVVVKKVRTRPVIEAFKTWVPLEIENIHAHWDDRCQQIHNVSEDDVGFTTSYRRI